MGKKFNKLARTVTQEYIKEGVKPATAAEWGKATAGKVFREKKAKRKGLHGHFDGRC